MHASSGLVHTPSQGYTHCFPVVLRAALHPLVANTTQHLLQAEPLSTQPSSRSRCAPGQAAWLLWPGMRNRPVSCRQGRHARPAGQGPAAPPAHAACIPCTCANNHAADIATLPYKCFTRCRAQLQHLPIMGARWVAPQPAAAGGAARHKIVQHNCDIAYSICPCAGRRSSLTLPRARHVLPNSLKATFISHLLHKVRQLGHPLQAIAVVHESLHMTKG